MKNKISRENPADFKFFFKMVIYFINEILRGSLFTPSLPNISITPTSPHAKSVINDEYVNDLKYQVK